MAKWLRNKVLYKNDIYIVEMIKYYSNFMSFVIRRINDDYLIEVASFEVEKYIEPKKYKDKNPITQLSIDDFIEEGE